MHRCIWCDSTDHGRKECDSFLDALKRRLVFFKHKKIHLTKASFSLVKKFGKGGIKKVVDDMGIAHAIFAIEAATYGLKAHYKEGIQTH